MTEKPEEIRIEDEAAKEEDLPLQEEESQEASQESEENAEAVQAEAEEPAEKAEEPEKEEKAEPEKDDTRYLRLLAEFQNYKKRTEKEKTDLYSYANEKIMTELLEVLDNFERALEQEPGEGFKEGIELIFTQLSNVLSKAGLAEITALGEDFDPNVHNAVMAEETDEYESGKVSGVMQKGYTLNGKVIRPSMVKVAN